MRALLLLPVLCPILCLAAGSARADECQTLVSKIIAETGAKADLQRSDYATFTVSPNMTMSLACGAPALSSVGAQYKGETPPDEYYTTFAKAGQAVTGIDAKVIVDAAHKAQATASRKRHSNIDLGGALVTCSSMVSPDKGPLTLCAVIEHSDKS